MSFRVLPLFAVTRDADRYQADESELVEALCRLFEHWMRSRSPITVLPLNEWLATVLRQLLGLSTRPYDRRANGESVLVVRPDGVVFQVAEHGVTALALGDLRRQTIAEILSSQPYLASLDRTEAITRRRCTGCRFRGSCDGWPAHTAAVDHPDDARCQVTYRVQTYMLGYLERAGLSAAALRALLGSVTAGMRPGRCCAGGRRARPKPSVHA